MGSAKFRWAQYKCEENTRAFLAVQITCTAILREYAYRNMPRFNGFDCGLMLRVPSG
jgi:hypothetical protein